MSSFFQRNKTIRKPSIESAVVFDHCRTATKRARAARVRFAVIQVPDVNFRFAAIAALRSMSSGVRLQPISGRRGPRQQSSKFDMRGSARFSGRRPLDGTIKSSCDSITKRACSSATLRTRVSPSSFRQVSLQPFRLHCGPTWYECLLQECNRSRSAGSPS